MSIAIPFISIIVPMLNEEKNIAKCLSSLKRQEYSQKEIIVVDDGSIDNTVRIASMYADRILFSGRKGSSVAKNLGIKAARGEYVVFTDGDCIAEDNWLEELLRCFSSPEIVCAGGPNLTINHGSRVSEATGKILEFLSKFGFRYGANFEKPCFVKHNPSCNVMYKKDIFDKVGFFNDKLMVAEDEEMDYRITKSGYKVFYTPYARVLHYRKDSLLLFWKQFYKYSSYKALMVKSHRELFRFLFLLPSLAIILAAILTARFFMMFLVSVFLITLATSIYLCKQSKWGLFLYYMFLLPAGFLACGAGFIHGCIKKS